MNKKLSLTLNLIYFLGFAFAWEYGVTFYYIWITSLLIGIIIVVIVKVNKKTISVIHQVTSFSASNTRCRIFLFSV